MGSQGYKFLALLRGINVGGKNVISKDSLRQAFEDMGFTSVRTYIQSGNILFRSNDDDVVKHTKTVEVFLSDRFSYTARAFVYSESVYKSIVEDAPPNWGNNDQFRHRILFVLGNILPVEIMESLEAPNKDVETYTLGKQVIYSSVSKEHLFKSVLRKFATTPSYQQVTVRNHNTVLRLHALFDDI